MIRLSFSSGDHIHLKIHPAAETDIHGILVTDARQLPLLGVSLEPHRDTATRPKEFQDSLQNTEKIQYCLGWILLEWDYR